MTPALPDVEEVAIGWALRHVEGEMGFEEIERFADWLQQSPDHGEAFDRAMASWAMLEGPRFEPEILALRSEALDALHAVQSWRWRARACLRSSIWRWRRRASRWWSAPGCGCG
jgi:ferric-dicitrate binding protein FerR (iron transport regulator)